MFPETRIQGPRLRCKSLQGMTTDDQIFLNKIASCFLSIRSMYYLIASRLNILTNSKISVSYRENNTFISLLFKKKHINKLILFNGLITVLDCFFLPFNKTHN